MTLENNEQQNWGQLERSLPEWFADSPFGIFIHWGAYSVPAWAEPTGELGTVADSEWFVHNAYAEWYMNTIAIEGSPAQLHHQQVHGGKPYDELLDDWKAENFDPAEWAELFKFAGADYVVPTTKHHDGIALWNAPGTEGRNVVDRGPQRDLIGEISTAVKAAGMHLGLYYSGGLDWHKRPFPPHLTSASVQDIDRPKDADYAAYAYDHVVDLISRYQPELLWNDIEWPDAGKHFGTKGLGTLFQEFYKQCPTGVVNDRWGESTHHDYTTSEYEHRRDLESADAWENCRGIGLSFGYNQVEGPEQYLTGVQIARQLVDIVSRGGRFLLNVGPKADGTIPEIQRTSLLDLGAWMKEHKHLIVGAKPASDAPASESSDAWVRWIRRGDELIAFVDVLSPDVSSVRIVVPVGYRVAAGTPIKVATGADVEIELPGTRSGPIAVHFGKTMD